MMRRSMWCAVLLVFAQGCGSSGSEPEKDAAAARDAGGPLDGGSGTPDAGPARMDSGGSVADSGGSADSGVSVDSGGLADSGNPDDSGSPADSGTPDGGRAPTVTLTSGPGVAGASAMTADTTPTFTFTVTSATAVECRIDGAAFTDCSSLTFTTSMLTVAEHTFEVRATGSAGTANATVTFQVVRRSVVTAFDAYIKASNTGAEDGFGYAVAISADGSTLAVGASMEDGSGTGVGPASNEGATDSGAVYVYTRAGGVWSFQTYLKASNTSPGDQFGYAVSLSADGNTLAVGAIREDGSGTGVNPPSNEASDNSGAAYVYTRTGSAWSFQAYLKASQTGAGDSFGLAIALSANGDTLAVGSPGEDGSGTGISPASNEAASDSGATYVFRRTAGTWAFQAYVKASNTGAEDSFGTAVAISGDGNTLAIGAPMEDGSGVGVAPASDDSLDRAGAAYVYTRTADAWAFQTYVKASNPSLADSFGVSLDLSNDGDTLVVGANREGGSGMGVNPAVDDALGSSGAAYVYARSAGTWTFQAYLKASNPGSGDTFGSSVALAADGNALAVGAFGEDGSGTGINPPPSDTAFDAGAVYVYSRTGSTWAFHAYLKASNSGESDLFGYALAFSEDGTVLAVSGSFEDGSGSGINPPVNDGASDSGAVYTFR